MSKIIVCPYCCEYVGYTPKTMVFCAAGTATGRKVSFKQEYARCANCGKLFPNPAFKEENQKALEEADNEVLVLRHLPS